MSSVKIRRLIEADLDKVMEIENLCFVAPWQKDDIVRELNNNEFAILYVATVDDVVVGYVDFWITFDSATICQIAVHPDYQRQSIGSQLLSKAFKDCSQKEVLSITLEVRESNEKGICFYKKHGFIPYLTKPQYYSNGENAIYMIKGVA